MGRIVEIRRIGLHGIAKNAAIRSSLSADLMKCKALSTGSHSKENGHDRDDTTPHFLSAAAEAIAQPRGVFILAGFGVARFS